MFRIFPLTLLFLSSVGTYLWITTSAEEDKRLRGETLKIVAQNNSEVTTKPHLSDSKLQLPSTKHSDIDVFYDPDDRSFLQETDETVINIGPMLDADDRSFVWDDSDEQNIGSIETDIIPN